MAAEGSLRTLIVDDEPLAVERLQVICASLDAVSVVGTAADGSSALRLIQALSPDLILLDVSMPGLDGLGLARSLEDLPTRPAVVFCTAFDQYAVAAFDVAACDYLLKPITPERLTKAIGRVHDGARQSASAGAPAKTEWIQEIWAPHRAEMIRIAVTRIDRIEAERDYMRLFVGSRSYLVHQTIAELERKLDPRLFIRLHRSVIVRRDFIGGLKHDGRGAWQASLLDQSTVKIGRTYLAAAKALVSR
ncbi:MAG: LytTR family two component transcriptional regulator [Caulobacteraceae bacterium]|jgi:two-component system response regulator AlgR|nr:LytTR family two component transcriptional regulator [Caulobacteraceae bacterium]